MQTSFEYELKDHESKEVMERGFKNFRDTSAFVLAFNYPRIQIITIKDQRKSASTEEIF